MSARSTLTCLLVAVALVAPRTAMAAEAARTETAVSADVLARTYLFVHQALVFVEGAGGDGSGFVVAVDAVRKRSYILTAAHVVCKKGYESYCSGAPATVILNDDADDAHRATVIAAERESEPGASRMSDRPDLDLALLELDGVGDIQPLYVPWEAREGLAVAVAGYPVSSEFARHVYGELRPTLHEGVISAVRLRGLVIEHSAVTDEGNSGGPLFDANNGYVLGIVEGKLQVQGASGAYLSTGFLAINSFLEAHRRGGNYSHAYFGLPDPGKGFARFPFELAKGRSRLIYASALTVRPELKAYHTIDEKLTKELQSVFDTPVVTDSGTRLKFIPGAIKAFTFDPSETFTQYSPPIPELSAECGSKAVGVLYFNPVLSRQQDGTQRLSANVALFSCHGNVLRFFYAEKKIGTLAKQAVIQQALDGLVDAGVEKFREKVEQEPSRFRNFLLYGWFMADNESSALFGFDIHPDTHEVYVNYIDPEGTAYRSGLRLYDTVVSINGHTTEKHTPEMLDYEIESYWALGVKRPDRDATTVCFPAENLGWYLDHAADADLNFKCPNPHRKASTALITVDSNPIVVQGDVSLAAGTAVIDLSGTVNFVGYFVSATDTSHPERGVKVSSQTATGFTLAGPAGDSVHWIAVGSISPQQSYPRSQP